MNQGWKIGLLTAMGLGLGTCAKLFYPQKKAKKKAGCGCKQTDVVKKTIGGASEDGYDDKALIKLKSHIAPSLLARQEQFIKDLARWGTKEGIIDVADLLYPQRIYNKLKAIQEGRIASFQTPANLKLLDRYIIDLERWGTEQGVIDVSNDEGARKKEKNRLKKMARQGQSVTRRYLKAKKQEFKKQGKPIANREQLLAALQKDYEVTQVTIQNRSNEERPVALWEANKAVAVSPPKLDDVEDHELTESITLQNALHPQGMAFNSANGFIYVANQLSNNVSVLDHEGQLVKLIQLEPSNFPGLNSPVDIAVNTRKESEHYGKVYVIGSVSNTLSIIDQSFEVEQVVNVGVRPLGVAFNPQNEKVYVSNYVDNTLSVIDANSFIQEIINVGKHPLGVGVHPQSGEVWVANSGDHSIHIFDQDNNLLTQINEVGQQPSQMAYHLGIQQMFVVATESNEVIPIQVDTYEKEPAIAVGNKPSRILFNPNNDFIYVANKGNNRITVIHADHSVRATLDLGLINNGFTLDPNNNVLFTSVASSNSIGVIGYKAQSSLVVVDEDLDEKRRDFQQNPVVVKHARFILSGNDRFNVLRLREGNATGNSTVRTLSFNDFYSPQMRQNVSEVNGLEGAVIDGANGWEFMVAPQQTVTMMVYYRQFDLYNLLPEKARESIGAEMSKGISRQLSDPNSNYNPII